MLNVLTKLYEKGPFVHIGAMIGCQCTKFIPYQNRAEYESRFLEVIAVGCACGVAGIT